MFALFKRSALLIAVFGTTASSSLEVFSNILLDHNHDDMYSTIAEPTVPRACAGTFGGQARVSPSFIRTLQEKIGIFAVASNAQPVVHLTTLTESSVPHVDAYHHGRQGSPDRVGFVFLNTNPDAHFVHGESTVPIVEGRMVLFDGSIPHNTIVNSGSVKLLGPFDAKDFRAVGATTAPSTKPSAPTTKSGKGPKSSKTTGLKNPSVANGDENIGSLFDGMVFGPESLSISMSFSIDQE